MVLQDAVDPSANGFSDLLRLYTIAMPHVQCGLRYRPQYCCGPWSHATCIYLIHKQINLYQTSLLKKVYMVSAYTMPAMLGVEGDRLIHSAGAAVRVGAGSGVAMIPVVDLL